MYKCPHCEEESISLWSKIGTGPLSSVTCLKCGKRSSTTGSAQLFALIPVIIAVFLPNFIPALVPFKVQLIAIVVVVSMLIYGMAAPLVKR